MTRVGLFVRKVLEVNVCRKNAPIILTPRSINPFIFQGNGLLMPSQIVVRDQSKTLP